MVQIRCNHKMSNNPQSSMSEVAQKLCDEIVKRNSKPPTTEEKPWRKTTNCPGFSRSRSVLKSDITEKKKVVCKLLPQTTDFKSKNSMLKKTVTDVAVNTLVTGPLRCDNNCVTVLRKRDNKVCKCAQRYSHKSSIAKQLQTFESRNYLYTDKASAQCVETASCGTQFFENKKHISTDIQPKERTNKTTVNYDHRHPNCDTLWGLSSNLSQQLVKQYPNYMSSKRWALTQYPTRGPDF